VAKNRWRMSLSLQVVMLFGQPPHHRIRAPSLLAESKPLFLSTPVVRCIRSALGDSIHCNYTLISHFAALLHIRYVAGVGARFTLISSSSLPSLSSILQDSLHLTTVTPHTSLPDRPRTPEPQRHHALLYRLHYRRRPRSAHSRSEQ
jgi:hypothetical protein